MLKTAFLGLLSEPDVLESQPKVPFLCYKGQHVWKNHFLMVLMKRSEWLSSEAKQESSAE